VALLIAVYSTVTYFIDHSLCIISYVDNLGVINYWSYPSSRSSFF